MKFDKPRPWSSRKPGPSEADWLAAIDARNLPRLDITQVASRYERIVLLAAHPDDETLAVGATLAQLVLDGARVEVVVATDGEASHPDSTTLTPAALANVRRAELTMALAELGVTSPPQFLGLPDGRLPAHSDAVRAAIEELLAAATGTTLLLAPWLADGHCDHDLLGEAALEAACGYEQADVAFYPLWLWHWADVTPRPDVIAGVSVQNWVAVTPSPEALHRRAAAVGRYASQTTTFGLDGADGPVLGAQPLARAARLVEFLIVPDGTVLALTSSASVAAEPFDTMLESTDDPWGVETSWYEERRRNLILAMAPEADLGDVLDIGCSTGRLTLELAARATSVIAIDQSQAALAIARKREVDNVEWRHARVPADLSDLPDASFTTVVLSEICYFLDALDLWALLRETQRVLRPNGVAIVANWRHRTRDIPLDGELVRSFIEHVWSVSAHYADDDVDIQICIPNGER